MKAPIIGQGAEKDAGTGRGDAAEEMAAAVIRKGSAAARLVSASEITLYLEEQLAPDTDMNGEAAAALLSRLVLENEDLHVLGGAGVQWYYSSHSMTGAYAKVLLQAQEGPVKLIAETVRHNSGACQRPIPIGLFENPPFNLACRQVLDCLSLMAATEGYGDIATTTTSTSGVYLYSTAYLDTGHAVMLAEWFDVGQADNP